MPNIAVRFIINKPMSEVTLILEAIGRGENLATEELFPVVYEELRRMAAARMARENAGQTLQPTALVHEAWLQLVGEGGRTRQNRAHFFGAAADCKRRLKSAAVAGRIRGNGFCLFSFRGLLV
jgi:hypothetical protein